MSSLKEALVLLIKRKFYNRQKLISKFRWNSTFLTSFNPKKPFWPIRFVLFVTVCIFGCLPENTKALFQIDKREINQISSSSRFAFVDYEIRTDVPFLQRVDLQISRESSSERMQWPSGLFDARAIYRYNAGNHRCTYKPTNHIDSSVPTAGNNANRGRSLRKDRPLERSLIQTRSRVDK
ncbi:hypothetical protein AVEN_92936-1 [Araneus ventricosus]|uniref:Uncharacterized protein n=1 Tax=Araneus ventricosus TaxID=182803 RepID=A0A4Y2WIT1_ARAVE|nr:hypothetical protein AVEN_92936-1 [Araneus ventricosus]